MSRKSPEIRNSADLRDLLLKQNQVDGRCFRLGGGAVVAIYGRRDIVMQFLEITSGGVNLSIETAGGIVSPTMLNYFKNQFQRKLIGLH